MNLSMFHDTATHQLNEVSKAGLRVLALSMRKSSGDEVCYQIERAAKSGRLSDYHAAAISFDSLPGTDRQVIGDRAVLVATKANPTIRATIVRNLGGLRGAKLAPNGLPEVPSLAQTPHALPTEKVWERVAQTTTITTPRSRPIPAPVEEVDQAALLTELRRGMLNGTSWK